MMIFRAIILCLMCVSATCAAFADDAAPAAIPQGFIPLRHNAVGALTRSAAPPKFIALPSHQAGISLAFAKRAQPPVTISADAAKVAHKAVTPQAEELPQKTASASPDQMTKEQAHQIVSLFSQAD